MKRTFLENKLIEILSISTIGEKEKISIIKAFNERTNDFDKLCIIKQIEYNYCPTLN